MSTAPAILLSLKQGLTEAAIAQLLWGVEEEGIPLKTISTSDDQLIVSAWQAACQSPLLVGVAADQQQIIVHYKNLAADRPLFTFNDYRQRSPQQLRALGCNIARLVKGQPFKPLNN